MQEDRGEAEDQENLVEAEIQNKMNWDNLLSAKTVYEETDFDNPKSVRIHKESDAKTLDQYPCGEFEKDYSYITSSAAFRRLQDKAQVFPLEKNDFVRTRLTHSIEVSAIARRLGDMVTRGKINEEGKETVPDDFSINTSDQELREKHLGYITDIPMVLACAGLLHDLGNPPFGHYGEEVIRTWFKDNLGEGGKLSDIGDKLDGEDKAYRQDFEKFDGNAQVIRLLSKIRIRPEGNDLNLTYCVVNSLLKYTANSMEVDDDDPDCAKHKCGYFQSEKELVDQICSETGTKIKSEKNGADTGEVKYCRHPLTYLLEAADDIAYATADLEDAVKKGLITVPQFITCLKKELHNVEEKNKKKDPDGETKDFTKTRKWVEDQAIQNLISRLDALNPSKPSENQEGENCSENTENSDDTENSENTKDPDLDTPENEFSAFQKWMIYMRDWFMYCVAFSFTADNEEKKIKNYEEIMSGTYKKDLFYSTFYKCIIKAMKNVALEYSYNSQGVLKLEISAQEIISFLLDNFVNAAVYQTEKEAGSEPSTLTLHKKLYEKLWAIISDNLKDDYNAFLEQNPDASEAKKLYNAILMVIDFISGMTDSYARDLYRELKGIN